MERLIVAKRTEVVIGRGLPDPLLPRREGRARVAVLTQPAPTSRALEVTAAIRAEGLAVEVVGLPDREEAKTLEVAAGVYEALGRFGLARADTVVGVGGGAVTDLAGFVAGTWLRGVEVVHVPTTLLAAVDAAVGGKTGVNVGGKNLVGVFWHPSRVAIDVDHLATLPGDLVREGMAEAYKAGLVGDAGLVEMIGAEGLDAPLEEVIARSLRVKAALVDADPSESGVRAHLNFGHTIGHAVEFASSLPHGSCVALGMLAAVRISEEVTGFSRGDEVADTIRRLGLPTRVRGLDKFRVLDLLGQDKKRNAEGSRMVLLRDVESPELHPVGMAEIELGLRAIGF